MNDLTGLVFERIIRYLGICSPRAVHIIQSRKLFKQWGNWFQAIEIACGSRALRQLWKLYCNASVQQGCCNCTIAGLEYCTSKTLAVEVQWLNLCLADEELLELHGVNSPNSFTGFRNMGNTCFVNAILQTFLHVAALRRWILEPLPFELGVFLQPELRKLQGALHGVLRRHSPNVWSVMVPLELLQCLFELAAERYGMIAGRQFDAVECFKLFHNALGSPNDLSCYFLDVVLQYPRDYPKDVHYGISQVLYQIAAATGHIRNTPPPTLVLSVLPYLLRTETDAEWVDLTISGWDVPIDLAPFFRHGAADANYYVKAVVYHLHSPDGPVVLSSGHYVAYVKQGGLWHLANDRSVRPVLMTGLRGLPYLLVLERVDVPGEELIPKAVQGHASEIAVDVADALGQLALARPASSGSQGFPGSPLAPRVIQRGLRKRKANLAGLSETKATSIWKGTQQLQRRKGRQQLRQGRQQLQSRKGRQQGRHLGNAIPYQNKTIK